MYKHIDELILATNIDGENQYVVTDIHTGESYNYLVREIMNDKKYGGSHNLYRADGANSHDPVIGRLVREKNKWDELIAKNRAAMDKVIASIEAAMKRPDEKGYRPARKGDMVRWQDESMKLQEEFVEFRENSAKLLPIIEEFQYNHYIEEVTRKNMRALRDKFFRDGDVVYLEKGVTWAMNYSAKHRLEIDYKSLAVK